MIVQILVVTVSVYTWCCLMLVLMRAAVGDLHAFGSCCNLVIYSNWKGAFFVIG
jgi:hypothetical protein